MGARLTAALKQRGAHTRHGIGGARQAQHLSAGALHGHDLGHQFPAGGELVAHKLRNVLEVERFQDLILDAHDMHHPMFRLADVQQTGATLALKQNEDRIADTAVVRFPIASNSNSMWAKHLKLT